MIEKIIARDIATFLARFDPAEVEEVAIAGEPISEAVSKSLPDAAKAFIKLYLSQITDAQIERILQDAISFLPAAHGRVISSNMEWAAHQLREIHGAVARGR